MSFWSTSDGTAITPEKEYSAGGGSFETIPEKTKVLVSVDEAAWKAGYQITQEFVNLKCRVLKPEAYANRVLFFKLWVDELDPSVKDAVKAETKRDKHKKMLMAIDANAKGRLAKLTARPTDEQLSLALVAAQFVAQLGVWSSNDKTGNWLMAASPKGSEVTEVASKARSKPAAPLFDDDDDDIPF